MKRFLSVCLLLLLLGGCFLLPVMAQEPPATTGSSQGNTTFDQTLFEKLILNDPDALALHQRALSLEEAVLEDDFPAAYALVSETASESAFRKDYQTIQALLADGRRFCLNGFSSSTENGAQSISLRYALCRDSGEVAPQKLQYEVSFTAAGDTGVLESFALQELPSLADQEMQPGNRTFYWVFYALCMGFLIFTVMDCFRRNVKLKWLWLALFVVGWMRLSYEFDGSGVQLRFQLLQLPVPGLTERNALGHFSSSLTLPAAAIVYWFLRKRLKTNPKGTPPTPEPPLPSPTEQNRDSL